MREEDEQLVQKLLGRLPVELRECLVLREIEELSYKEIARVIDVPVGNGNVAALAWAEDVG